MKPKTKFILIVLIAWAVIQLEALWLFWLYRGGHFDQTTEFALWGSTPPPAMISLIFPNWGSLFNTSFYIGAIPFYFVIISLISKKTEFEKGIWWMFLGCTLWAFGKFTPVVPITFCLFPFLRVIRHPSTALGFSTFCLAILAGFGIQKIIRIRDEKFIKIVKLSIYIIMFLVVAGPGDAQFVYDKLRPSVVKLGNMEAQKAFKYKKDPSDLSEYQKKSDGVIQRLDTMFSYQDRGNQNAILFYLLSGAAILIYLKRRKKEEKCKKIN